jgi:hypothetical protein
VTPDLIEAACVMVDSLLAGNVSAAACAARLLNVPNSHPLRHVETTVETDRGPVTILADHVYDMAARVSKGIAPPDELRAFCEALRAGKAEMLATGWYATLHGPHAEAV